MAFKPRFLESLYRILTRAGFLAVALLLGLFFWYLPNFLNLDAYRPQITELLETTFHCKVLVGRVTGQLVPSPGLAVGRVVFLEVGTKPRVLASVSTIRLSLTVKALWKGHLSVETIRFVKPRFIAHREKAQSGDISWSLLSFPEAGTAKGSARINDWQIRNGSIEIWDHTTSPTTKWVADQCSGDFEVLSQRGALAGKAAHLGSQAVLNVHYNRADPFPVQIRVNDAELSAFQSLIHTHLFTLSGSANLDIQARFKPAVALRATFNQPSQAGEVTISMAAAPRGKVNWLAVGKHSYLKGTDFQLPEWSAKGDPQGVSVYARAITEQGGMAEVGWTLPVSTHDATLEVNVSSVTIQQILEVFKLQSKTTRTAGRMNPYGYESWNIPRGSLVAVIHEGTSFEVKESDIDLNVPPLSGNPMHLDLTGTFEMGKPNAAARVQGGLANIPMVPVLESFFTPPSSLTGIGGINFVLTFPISSGWIKGINGPMQVLVINGVLRELKTIYRIFAVLNLGNYLRLRLPQVSAQGIEFEALSGRLQFQNGVLTTEDLFLKSPNMNLGAKGSLDIPGQTINMKVRLEVLRFLEDILKAFPITKWIFKRPNKIFLPVVVSVDGPWKDVNIH